MERPPVHHKAASPSYPPNLAMYRQHFRDMVFRGNASPTSQWAFLECHGAMETHEVSIKCAPGHSGIEGNEIADRLANLGARHPSYPTGKAAMPTLSGIKSIARTTLHNTQRV